jgi:hypothetical protein
MGEGEKMNLDINELVEYVQEKLGGSAAIDKETLYTIFDLETEFMIEKGIIEVVDELNLEG